MADWWLRNYFSVAIRRDCEVGQVAALPGFAKCADGAARLVEIEFQNYSSHHRGDYAVCRAKCFFWVRPFQESEIAVLRLRCAPLTTTGGIKRREE